MTGEVKQLAVKGEYWITDNGEVIYCDGDAGAEIPNHELVVVQRAWSLLESGLENCADTQVIQFFQAIKPVDDDGLPDLAALREAAHTESDAMHKAGNLPEEAYDDIYGWLTKAAGVDEWITDAAFSGFDSRHDLRAYAMKVWGWIRIAGMNITIPTVTKAICSRLHEGLEEICDQEAINDYTNYNWAVECINPGGYVMDLSGGLVTDHKTLRGHFVRTYVRGWSTNQT